MRTRSLLWLRRFALVCAALLAGLLIAGLYCAHTQNGRSFVGRRIERFVTANIPGRFSIGKITRLGLSHVEAQEVRFYHPDGRCVLSVDEAEVDLELADALHGRLSFERAVARGGYMLMSIDPDDRLSFEAAVNAPTKPGEANVPTSGLHYALRNMHAENLQVLMRFGSFEFRLLEVNGVVTVQRIDTPGVQVLLSGFRASLQQEIAGAHVKIKQLDGTITGKARQVADLTTTLRVGDGDLRAQVGYFDRKKDKLKLRVLKKEGVAATTMTWLLEAIAGFSSDLHVEG
jgi:hypothetical protein